MGFVIVVRLVHAFIRGREKLLRLARLDVVVHEYDVEAALMATGLSKSVAALLKGQQPHNARIANSNARRLLVYFQHFDRTTFLVFAKSQ